MLFRSNYKSNTGTCSAHFIREMVLYDIVLEDLRETIAYVRDYEQDFIQAVMDKSTAEQRKDLNQKRRELTQAERRITELDALFQRVYEDNVSGKLSDERFSKLAKAYEDEQKTLTARAEALQAELTRSQEKAVNLDRFISLVHENLEVKELTPKIVNEFIARIIVYAPDKSSGKRTQRVRIIYNLIGEAPRQEKKTA